MRACVIFNPVAKGDRARRFRAQLDALAGEVCLRPTQAPGGARPLAAQAVREGFDTVVAAGGDGTVNEVLNGLADEPDGWRRARLAVMPFGTVNVFARELGLPFAPPRAWAVIRAGHERAVDVVRVDFSRGGQPAAQHFVQMAGAGLDARSVELVRWELKKKIGSLAYVIAGFQALRGPHPLITVKIPGREDQAQFALVGNGRFYGGSFELFPRADHADGLLDVTLFPRVGLGVLLRCLPGFLTGRFEKRAGLRHYRAASVELSAAAPVPFELEGDVVGHLPVRFTPLPRALRVVVPA